MRIRSVVGVLHFALVVATIIGLFQKIPHYWTVVNVAVIVVCAVGGVLLLKSE